MEIGLVDRIFETSISLGVLAIVLIGLYRLTNRVIDVISNHLVMCCDSLERIANALEEFEKE